MSQEQQEQEPKVKLKKNLRRRLNQGSRRWKLEEQGIGRVELEGLKFQRYLRDTDRYDQDS